jgi:hypothetical protein
MKPNRKTRRKTAARRRSTLEAPVHRLPGILFNALPTNREIESKLTADGKPSMVFPGRIVLTSAMKSELYKHATDAWHPGHDNWEHKPDWIVNMLADPDRYAVALEQLDQKLTGNPVPVFNHPRAILNTQRDVIWKQLADVENLISPRCDRFVATHPDHFRAAFEKGEFDFPVLIRPAGSHTGNDLIIIENERDWDKIYTVSWSGHEMYMTQWVDFQAANGDWPKLRLSVTCNGIKLRHILYGDSWLVHSTVRDTETVERELEVLLGADNWQALQKLGADIRQKVDLDFFGVDLGWKSESEFVLFEANASMSILSNRHMPEHRREDYVENLRRIEQDVWQALSGFADVSQ